MLVGTGKAAASRIAVPSNKSRSFACTAASLSSPSNPSQHVAQQGRLRRDPHRKLVDKIVQIAVQGSRELDQRAASPGRDQSSGSVQGGFKPTPRRQTPEQPLPWLSASRDQHKRRRGRLVAYQVEHDRGRNTSALAQAVPSQSGPTRRYSTKPPKRIGDLSARGQRSETSSIRNFATSSSTRLRLDEYSLIQDDDTVEQGGLWNDAEAGENPQTGNKGKARELRPGDWVDTSRYVVASQLNASVPC